MFRGKESSNRIELSRSVQDLLNFGVSGSLQLWGWGGGWMGVGWLADAPHTRAHACMHTHAHAHMVNIIWCKWPPPLGEYLGIHYDVIHICMHMCMHVHIGGVHLSPPPPHLPTPHPGGDPQNHSKFNSTWTNQDISILFEDLKSVETPPPMGGCIIWWLGGWVGGWVGWWVGSGQITKKFENCWLNQDNSILFEDLWFVETPPPMGGCGWLGGWVGQWVGSGQMTKNLINLDLIEVIQFCLKIYDL